MSEEVARSIGDVLAENARLKQPRGWPRAALAALGGEGSADELRQMEAIIRVAPVPDTDKAAMLNAIHVLLEG